MIIESLIEFDKEHLSFWKLVIRHHKRWHLIGTTTLLVIAAIFILIPISFDNKTLFVLWIPGGLVGWFSVWLHGKESLSVIRHKYEKKFNLT